MRGSDADGWGAHARRCRDHVRWLELYEQLQDHDPREVEAIYRRVRRGIGTTIGVDADELAYNVVVDTLKARRRKLADVRDDVRRSPLPATAIDDTDHFLATSVGGAMMFGYAPGELVGRHANIIDPLGKQPWRKPGFGKAWFRRRGSGDVRVSYEARQLLLSNRSVFVMVVANTIIRYGPPVATAAVLHHCCQPVI